MKINEYRTDGRDVILLRDDGSGFHWVDATACGVEVSGEAAIAASAGPDWRTMSGAESQAWLCMIPSGPVGRWRYLCHVASLRADAAEAVVEHLKETVRVLSDGVAKWRPVAEAAAAEVDRLRNAARSRLKCPSGHNPGQSRGACWYCDAEHNARLLDRLTAEIDANGGEVSARDLLGMWDVARERADKAESMLSVVRDAVKVAEVKPLPPGTYYTEHVEHGTKISEANRLAIAEIRRILGMEGGK